MQATNPRTQKPFCLYGIEKKTTCHLNDDFWFFIKIILCTWNVRQINVIELDSDYNFPLNFHIWWISCIHFTFKHSKSAMTWYNLFDICAHWFKCCRWFSGERLSAKQSQVAYPHQNSKYSSKRTILSQFYQLNNFETIQMWSLPTAG